MLLWTRVCKYEFEILLSILLHIHSEMNLIDHIVILFLIFEGASTLFSLMAAPFYIPIKNAQVFLFLHILTNTYYFLSLSLSLYPFLIFFNSSHPNGLWNFMWFWLEIWTYASARKAGLGVTQLTYPFCCHHPKWKMESLLDFAFLSQVTKPSLFHQALWHALGDLDPCCSQQASGFTLPCLPSGFLLQTFLHVKILHIPCGPQYAPPYTQTDWEFPCPSLCFRRAVCSGWGGGRASLTLLPVPWWLRSVLLLFDA